MCSRRSEGYNSSWLLCWLCGQLTGLLCSGVLWCGEGRVPCRLHTPPAVPLIEWMVLIPRTISRQEHLVNKFLRLRSQIYAATMTE